MTDTLYEYIANLPYHRRLVVAMAVADITIKELAYELGTSTTPFYKYRCGQEVPGEKRRQRLDDIFSSRVPELKGLLKQGEETWLDL